MPCHTYVIQEEADLKDAISFAYRSLHVRDIGQSGTDDGEPSGDVRKGARKYGINNSRKSDLVYCTGFCSVIIEYE